MADLETIGNCAQIVLCAGSLAVSGWALANGVRRRAPLIFAPREPVSWPAPLVGVTFFVALIVPKLVFGLTEDIKSDSQTAVQWHCLAMAAQGLAVLGLLAAAGPLRKGDLGLRPANERGELFIGAGAFLASWIPVLLVSTGIAKLGWREPDEKQSLFKILDLNPGADVLSWIAVSVIVLAPLVEELTYRVLLQGWCESQMAPWKAILLSSVLFAAVHDRPYCFPLFPLAVILGYAYYRRRSYVAVVVAHSLFNATNLTLALLTSK
jgi:membrane protease YdiL (CAAX protease family)